MYVYDTREGYETLPLSGWIFPCIGCSTITSRYTLDREKCMHVYVPICNKCKKDKIKYNLDSKNIKYIKYKY